VDEIGAIGEKKDKGEAGSLWDALLEKLRKKEEEKPKTAPPPAQNDQTKPRDDRVTLSRECCSGGG
jgi:hypothetical protein